jgi:protocatechuate 3,4-dioxygenase beta subunit
LSRFYRRHATVPSFNSFRRLKLIGFRLRGHQFTDADGRYTLQTIVPGLYPGRTRHIHVKAQAPNQSILTTQLYFPNEPRNATDGIFSSELLMAISEASGGRAATFNFVL